MKRLLTIFCLTVVLTGCERGLREEPVLDGLTLSDWVELSQDEDVEMRRLAAERLGEFGSDEADTTVPALIKTLKDEDRLVRLNSLLAIEKIEPRKARKAGNIVGKLMGDKDKIISKKAMQVYKRIELDRSNEIIDANK